MTLESTREMKVIRRVCHPILFESWLAEARELSRVAAVGRFTQPLTTPWLERDYPGSDDRPCPAAVGHRSRLR